MKTVDSHYGFSTGDSDHTASSRTVFQLNENWHFRQADDPDSVYLETRGFPTEIHLDLLHHGLIPDPLIGKQEDDVQWVGEKPWNYRTTFWSPIDLLNDTPELAFLVFEGLDTYATVVLNGETILKSEDMFLPARVDVTDNMIYGEDNVLEITFESTFLIGKKIVEKHTDHRWGCWNGDPSRLASRKAQYQYGWDWGITALTCGPWKPIYIEVYESRIIDLHFSTKVDESLESATVVAKVDFEGQADYVKFDLSINGELVALCVEASGSSHTVEAVLRTEKPKLWYPRRYGKQPLYALTATLLAKRNGINVVFDTISKRFGLRRARVVQRALDDAPGTTFMFEINNIPIFCGGSNWIPAHNFQTLLDPQKYRDWVRLAADGNQIMLRVWGGGIYEQDAFYEACDETGMLVWQDFLFACGNYPAADPHFVDLVEREAVANVKRLSHHPCIVLWAGNNEDYQYRETEGLEYDPEDKDPGDWLKSTFPARYIYEKTLKDVITELVPDIYYHFGSPYGGKDTTDPTVGDIHQWNVWHGSQSKYQDFDKLTGRFVSEFGMEAYPNMRTVDKCLVGGEKDIDRYPQSSTIEFHNKAAGHERRLALYLAENIRYTLEPFEQYVYCTQLLQAEALGTAYRLWKRQWQGPGREYCAGALVWQLNDCWPAISWSIVDHFLRPKLAYFAVKREMELITVGMKRTVRTIPADKYTHAYIKTVHELEVWACNLTQEEVPVVLDVQAYTFSIARGDDATKRRNEQQQTTDKASNEKSDTLTTLLANRSKDLARFKVPVSREDIGEEAQTVVRALLFDPTKAKPLARAFNWPEPLKYVHLAKSNHLQVKLSMDEDEDTAHLQPMRDMPDWWRAPNNVCLLFITSDVPLKGVQIEVQDGEHVRFEDQGFDVMADEAFAVRVWGLGLGEEGRVGVRYLGM